MRAVGSAHIINAYVSFEQIEIPGFIPYMCRADGTLVVHWPIVHGFQPVATICVGPMALRKSYVNAN